MPIVCQTLEEEIGFKYVKAEYLVGTERYEEAIKELNEVIKQNPNFKNALIIRGETKYKLAAYKGAKMDAMDYINNNGITGKAASLLGKADFAMNNFDAAFNSISAAISIGEKDVKLYEMRAEIYESRNQKISACEDWHAAAKLGSNKGAINARKNCGIKLDPPTETKPTENQNDDSTVDNTDNTSDDAETTSPVDTSLIKPGEVISNGTITNDTTVIKKTQTESEEEGLLIPEADDTVNSVVIDEELTLDIYGEGLGKRAVLQKPSILILAEKDGVVTIEICVNQKGMVDYAEFVSSKSSLTQNSLVSLAIRKAKEFWFEDSDYPKQCGYISYKIKGS